MRIAISGSHRVGKTTVSEALADVLTGHELVPEPYHLLEEEGHAFEEMPTLDDFEIQLARSCRCLIESDADVIFDRCPLDILGYILTHRDAAAFHLDDWMPRIRESVGKLDLIGFVPIEEPDCIGVSRSEAPLRADVDLALRDIIVDDAYGLDVDVVTIAGPPAARVLQIVAHLRRNRHAIGQSNR